MCILKEGMNFSDPVLRAAAAALGGGASVLRIGGSDQNSLSYNLLDPAPMQACGCGHSCVLTAGTWRELTAFAASTGHRLLFGLSPDAEQATALVAYAAQHNQSAWAYTYGNELNSAKLYAGYQQLRQLLDALPPSARPLLAGPDVALARHAPLPVALAGGDSTITGGLHWVVNFTAAVGTTLDAVAWYCRKREEEGGGGGGRGGREEK